MTVSENKPLVRKTDDQGDEESSTYYILKNLILKKMAMKLIRERLFFENMYVRELMHI